VRSSSVIIRNAQTIDGSGAPSFSADLEITDGTIRRIGDLEGEQADRVIDASGLCVAPGFVDIHAHSDLTGMVNPAGESKIRQGVTLEVNGQCGYSPFPVKPQDRAELDALNPFITAQPDWTWSTTAEFLDRYEAARPSMNIAHMVGHGALRAWVMGFENRPASNEQIAEICAVTRQALAEGAIGVSFGLAYPLGSFAENDEVEAIMRVAARSNAHVSVHIRSEGQALIESLREIIDIARRVSEHAPLRLQCDHLKASGERYWGKIDEALETIEAAHEEGIDIAFDVYPYTAGSRHFSGSLPAWMHDGGNEALVRRLRDPECRAKLREMHEAWRREEVGESPFQTEFDQIIVMDVATDANAWTPGKSVSEIAAARDQDPIDAAMDLMAEEAGQISVVLFSMDEADVMQALAHPLGCIGSDGLVFAPYGPLSSGKPHPRSYGTYPRVIGHYARDRGIMTVEEAVRKCTSLPASRLGLPDRGVIKPGARADLVIFDREALIDEATFEDPHQYPTGVVAVIVNGTVTVQGDTNHNPGAGQVIRRGEYA